jgi:hypothetical protein
MRGSPPLHLVLLILLFGAISVPLAQLTFARAKVTMNHEVQQSGKTRTHIRFRFAHAPLSASVKLHGKDLMTAKFPPTGNLGATMELVIPEEGIEFLVSVTWPEGTPDTAFAMELEPDGLETQSQTRWSNGASLSEIFTFEWKQQP